MDLSDILDRYRRSIIKEWVRRLHTEVSPRYSVRLVGELRKTISAAYDAYCAAILDNDYSKVDRVVEDIGHFRFQAGFGLSEVQKAFELFRFLVVPVIVQEMKDSVPETVSALGRLDVCLSYTIHRFSDYFQAISEEDMRNYARILEIKVEDRTRELLESETKYRRFVEEIRDGYFVNQNGRIVFANKAFSDMHGYTLEETLGRPFTDFIAPESLEEVRIFYERRMEEKGSREHYVYSRLHKDGCSYPTENTVVTTMYEGRKAAIGICRDITERVEIEKRIREAENLAHIGRVTTALAHEIRNPLSSARMSIQMLLKNQIFAGKERRRLEILAQEVSRLNRIVTEMLDFAKPIRFDFQPVSMKDVVDSCLEAMETRIIEKDITVAKSFSKRLPLLMMDRGKMEQALINLLLNAIEAVARGGRIDIFVRQYGGREKTVRTEIIDNGPGIDAGSMPYIFDPFYSKKTKGTGLGLANTKKIAEAHGGSVQLVPGVKGGAHAVLSMPVGKGIERSE